MELKKFLSSRYSTDDFEDFIRERFYGLEIQDNSYTDAYLREKESIEEYRYLGKSELDDGKEIGFFEFKFEKYSLANKKEIKKKFFRYSRYRACLLFNFFLEF